MFHRWNFAQTVGSVRIEVTNWKHFSRFHLEHGPVWVEGLTHKKTPASLYNATALIRSSLMIWGFFGLAWVEINLVISKLIFSYE